MNEMLLPETVKDRAARAGLTMFDLLKRAKVSQSTWHRWQKGESKLSAVLYYRLLNALEAAEARAVVQ